MRYKCLTDGYIHAAKGKIITVNNGYAKDEEGNTLDIDLEFLKTSEDFVLLSETNESKPGTFTLGIKIGKTYSSIDEAKDAALVLGNESVHILKIVGKLEIIKKTNYINLEI